VIAIRLAGKGLQRWEKMRRRGASFFVLAWGVGFWGGMMFLLMGLCYPALTRGSDALTPAWIAISAALWTLGGLLFGVVTWNFNERAWRRAQTTHGTPAE
jgi:hypothetical protein